MKPTIVYLTAGGAGMYCGSCMHDNTLARAMARRGVDLLLTPMYTPIRTDEENVSIDRVFFNGVNVYLEQKIPGYASAPSFVHRLFDQKWMLRLATSLGIETSAEHLGPMTVSMLRGARGNQRQEVLKLAQWLAEEVRPDLIVMSNVLIAGAAPTLKEKLSIPILVTLQGDDIFLDDLVEPYKGQAFEEIHRLAESVDGFLAHSRFYADAMSSHLSIPREKIHLVPLGIDVHDFTAAPAAERSETEPKGAKGERHLTVGYLARLAPQ
jgi:glycosyltransferase involved in cell wall biosynthesis